VGTALITEGPGQEIGETTPENSENKALRRHMDTEKSNSPKKYGNGSSPIEKPDLRIRVL